MRGKYFLAILVTVAVMAILFFKDHAEVPMDSTEMAEDGEINQAAAQSTPQSVKVIENQASDSKELNVKSTQTEVDEQQAEIQKTFSAHLKQMGTCLGVDAGSDSEKTEPVFENLLTSLKPALGEMVVRMDDWTQQDLKYPDGSMKRIRTEIEYLENGNPTKRAQLYKINEQGMPELQQLPTAQSTDPTEEYLNSLKGEGQEILEEKGGRAYFQDGEELVMVERSGKIQSFSISKGEKTFSCTETDASTSNCQCL